MPRQWTPLYAADVEARLRNRPPSGPVDPDPGDDLTDYERKVRPEDRDVAVPICERWS